MFHLIPVQIGLKDPTYFPGKSQYPINREDLLGLQPTTKMFLWHGFLIPFNSPCNAPIFLVKKPSGQYWLVKNLQVINKAVIAIHSLVPKLYTLLEIISPGTERLIVLDLKDVFFYILLDLQSQLLFYFTCTDHHTQVHSQYTWTLHHKAFQTVLTLLARIYWEILVTFPSPGLLSCNMLIISLFVAQGRKIQISIQ